MVNYILNLLFEINLEFNLSNRCMIFQIKFSVYLENGELLKRKKTTATKHVFTVYNTKTYYNTLLQVQKKIFQNGDTSGNAGNGRHLCFFK
jgi:hypothetical protein